jgi:hypothetical protein
VAGPKIVCHFITTRTIDSARIRRVSLGFKAEASQPDSDENMMNALSVGKVFSSEMKR